MCPYPRLPILSKLYDPIFALPNPNGCKGEKGESGGRPAFAYIGFKDGLVFFLLE